MIKHLVCIVAGLMSATPSATARDFVSAVLTNCNNPDQPSIWPLPGEDAHRAGEKYAELVVSDRATLEATAKDLFVGPQSQTSSIAAVLFEATTDEGLQSRQAGRVSLQNLRKVAIDCQLSQAKALGLKGDVASAYIEVACPKAKEPWAKMRVGIEFSKGKVGSICLNLGDIATLGLPDSKKDNKVGLPK